MTLREFMEEVERRAFLHTLEVPGWIGHRPPARGQNDVQTRSSGAVTGAQHTNHSGHAPTARCGSAATASGSSRVPPATRTPCA